jgi:hypothetical protein
LLGIYNYDAKIHGKESSEYWSCNPPESGRLYNPLWSNQQGIEYIRTILGEDFKIPYFSVILFGNGCKLRIVRKQRGPYPAIGRLDQARSLLGDIVTGSFVNWLGEAQIEGVKEILRSSRLRENKKDYSN